MSDRSQFLAEQRVRLHEAIEQKMGSLTVPEACHLAEQWVIFNVPEKQRPWIRRRLPIMTRARYAVANQLQWGSFRCSGWPL